MESTLSIFDMTKLDFQQADVINLKTPKSEFQCSFYSKSEQILDSFVMVGSKGKSEIQVWDINSGELVSRLGDTQS